MEHRVMWVVGLLANSYLWGVSGTERPLWYYGGLDEPLRKMSDRPPTPLDFPFSAQLLLGYCYWTIIGTLALMGVLAGVFFMEKCFRAYKKPEDAEPAECEDPEEVALHEALHLLDTVMQIMWHRLRWLDSRRKGRRRASAFS